MIEKIHPVFLVGCLSCAFLTGALAQTSETTPQSDDKDGSYIRGWIAGNGGSEAVSLWAQSAKDEEPRKFSSAAAGEKVMNPGYTKSIAGSFQFQLKAGEKLLQSATAKLADNAACTVLAWRQGGKWELRVYADGPYADNVADRPLRLMNFAEDRETLISLDNGPETKVAANTVEEFKTLPKLASFAVKVLAVDGGAPAQSSGEVDFASTPSAYVVVAPDYRGRMRPRVIIGGNLPSLEE
jgi:hypothetical protein